MEIIKLILGILKQFFELRNRSKRTEVQVERLVQLYDAMSTISSLEGVTRVAILKIENSGGLIDPKVPLYTSVLHEDYSHPAQSIKARFNKLQIDQSYVRMVLKAIKEGHALFTEEELADDTMLNAIYKSMGVKAVEFHFIGSTPRAIYLLPISSMTTPNFYKSDLYRVTAMQGISKIKKALWNEKN